MRITSLTATNLMRLKAIDITPEGDLVIVGGRNGQGKTSVLNAIWFALGGGQAQRGTKRPIRDGEDSAAVTLHIGDLVVKRNWSKPDKTALTVTTLDGAKYTSPQQMLDKLVGRLSFDPLAFSMQDEKQQLADLLALVELPFDPSELAATRQRLFDERQEVGRDERRVRGQLESMAAPAASTERISVATTVAELRTAETHNEKVYALNNSITINHRRLESLDEEIARLTEQRTVVASDIDSDHRAVNELGPVKDLEPLRDRLDAAEDANRAADHAEHYQQVADEHTALAGRYAQYSRKLLDLDKKKAKALAAAKMPIDGLSFDDTGVLYRGIPFNQCSAAERLRVSLGMAMAMNPEIRVIRITDGSLLDSENMALISEMASANDYQVWIERIEDDAAQFVIEDGSVATAVTV